MYVEEYIVNEEAKIVEYDPTVTAYQVYKELDYLETRSHQENRRLVTVVNEPYEACRDVHAIAILTEWDEFKAYDWARIKENMKRPSFVFDGRKILDREQLEGIGFKYYAIGE